MFDNLEYTRDRLVNTVIRVGVEPIFVVDVNKRYKCSFVYLHSPDNQEDCDLTDLNLEAVPLGYLNFKGGSVFTMRKPMRRDWRQGLRIGNMFFEGGCPFLELPFKELRKTILGEYLKPKELEAYLKKGNAKVAFHRHWAVDADRKLLYKERVVGVFNGGFTLHDNNIHLNEYLQEVVENAYNL